ncbi:MULTISPECIES: hypothetical protein [unclassified Pseudomonas]|uniref:hypothetical protein n=1 Tax=unclassified Pseudomonas TaxID=196821 RepID=UPI00244CDA0B|nr:MULTISPECIES: hypothetical protein [unclassified Pseudomonas]MDH0894869.1 hypothetical protein [Pseudomonas sp. GD03875]MDH1063933.1 hypothetical protein [Pseudomonas sp. GD03985]
MVIRCLICNSSAVMSKDAAKAIALLIGTLDGFLQGLQQSKSQPDIGSPLEQAFDRMLDGLSHASAHWEKSSDFARDVQRHQFMHYDCLCLRCGATFDVPAAPDT